MKNSNNNKNRVKDFLYEDITYKIRGCAFNVYNKLGFGHKESVYQKSLTREFKKAGLNFEEEKVVSVIYDGEKVGVYKPDFIVENKVIIEIKATEIMPKSYEVQLIYYLRGSNYKLGLLINFGGRKLEIRRRINTYRNQR